jgi:hypothetical protein
MTTDTGYQNHVYDEHEHKLQIYWSDRDVITWLAENSDDEHLKKVKQNAEQHALKMEVASRSVNDEKALFDEDDAEDDEIVLGRSEKILEERETSKQRLLSQAKVKPEFEGLKVMSAGHKVQEIRELMTVPVCLYISLQFKWCLILLFTGYCHCRFDQESPCYQSVQRQPVRRTEVNDFGRQPSICTSMPKLLVTLCLPSILSFLPY